MTGASLSKLGASIWRWWRGEMASVLAPVVGAPRVLEVFATDNALQFRLRRGGRVRELDAVPLDRGDPITTAAAIRALVRQMPGRYDRLEVTTAPGRGLRRELTLPLAARGSLAETVRYDIDRQTPFSEDMIHFGVDETGIDRATGKLMVRLDVVQKVEIDPVIRALSDAGLRPDAARLSPGNGPNLAPPQMLRREPGWMRPAIAFGLASLVGLSLLALYLPLYQTRNALDEIESGALEARHAALEVQAQRQKLDDLALRESTLIERKKSEPMVLEILAETTRRLPDGAFLVQLTLADGVVSMTGFAGRAAPLLELIEQSPVMSDAAFSEPVFRDTRVDAERFALTAKAGEESGK